MRGLQGVWLGTKRLHDNRNLLILLSSIKNRRTKWKIFETGADCVRYRKFYTR